MVLRRCRQILRDEEAAVDAMQDVFVRLLKNQQRLDDRGLSSLLYRIATNVCLNRIRSAKRHPEDPQGELLAQIACADNGPVDRSESRSLLARIFFSEPESSGAIAVLHWVDGLTLQEVADEVGMSVSGVRKRLARIKTALDRSESHASTNVQEAQANP
jgi:RNA polymerase sigma-70 factor (ECF subfamily)